MNQSELIVHLRALGNSDIDPQDAEYGICYEISRKLTNSLYLKCIGGRLKWPKYTGNTSYPVPHKHLNSQDAFENTDSLWDIETQYGRDRRELCLFLADELEKTLLTCDCCDEGFNPESEWQERHVHNDETTQCAECIEKVEKEFI